MVQLCGCIEAEALAWSAWKRARGRSIGRASCANSVAAEFVAPYRQGGKNDANDAAAIGEAVSQPKMRFVAVKSVEQQAALALHRLQRLVEERTALANRLRGLLTEYGVVVGTGLDRLRRALPAILEGGANGIAGIAREVFADAADQLRELDARIAGNEAPNATM